MGGVAVFAALGVWQLERRVWKLDLIARVEQRVHAPAIALPVGAQGAADEYRHVALAGHWRSGAETWVRATTELGPGWWELSALKLADGRTVFVNRGFVARPGTPGADEPASGITLTGLIRPSEPGGSFLRPNVPAANRWYSRDVAALAAAHGLGRVEPFFVDADAAPQPAAGAPIGGLTVIRFRNEHLQYALTWFALALGLGYAGWQVR
ncbi:MAG: SURF1 family protein, partial [Burkholderiales bacterium]|nr:SURF1 family protein [Burkholderiales bacterium]